MKTTLLFLSVFLSTSLFGQESIETSLFSEFDWDLNTIFKLIGYVVCIIIIFIAWVIFFDEEGIELTGFNTIQKLLFIAVCFNFTFGTYYLVTNNIYGEHKRKSHMTSDKTTYEYEVFEIKSTQSDILFGSSKEENRYFHPLGGNEVTYSYEENGLTYQELFALVAVSVFLLFCSIVLKNE
tara:strand:- start:557 stop:1099 length:543 start_codon:yes stop_codon:yes gene_type:complete